MAKYRQIYTDFWSDTFILELTPEEKLFYLYLISNSKTRQSGVFEVSSRIIQIETGLNNEVIEKLLNKFCELGKILYSTDTKEIMVLNWMKYNIPNNVNAIKCVNRELSCVKHKKFLKILYDKCKVAKLDVDKIFQDIIIEENNEVQDNNNREKSEPLELCRDYLLYAPFTGDLQAPYHALPSNRIRSNKEKVMSKEQELINKEEEEVASKSGEGPCATNCDGLKGVIKLFEENVQAITPLVYEKILEFTKHVSANVIIMAINEAVDNNAKTINYISKILNSWISNGISTVQQVIAYQKQWASNKKSSSTKTVKPGSFCDYEQRTYDFDLLEKGLLGQL
ncbi:MAG: DnaD domain-containing protein [Clostridium sp.]|uniref:DnaD domain-containing protein n=1 Tax=Clostridium sp. TaxID=1506 RepID=UPI003D6CA4C3